MFEYLDANQASGQPFIILDKPIQVFKTSMDYRKDGVAEKHNLPQIMTCYLIDEAKAPYDKVKDLDGNEVNNLVTFQIEEKNCRVNLLGEEVGATHLNYNFFNYPAPVAVEDEEGNVQEVRKKYLDRRYRANVFFPKSINAKVWDRLSKTMQTKSVSYAKTDLPVGLFSKNILDQIETVRETLGEDVIAEPKFSNFIYSFEFNPTAAPAEKYSKVKVKQNKEQIDAEKHLKAFVKEKKDDFIPPTVPF